MKISDDLRRYLISEAQREIVNSHFRIAQRIQTEILLGEINRHDNLPACGPHYSQNFLPL